MGSPTLTYTLTNNTTADATQVMQNFNDLLNGVTDGTKDLSISALTVAGNFTANGTTNTIGNSSTDDLVVTASLASTLAIKTNNTYGIGGSALGLSGTYFSSAANFTTRLVFGSGVSNITWTMPGTNGTNGYALVNDGAGAFSYVPALTGTNAVASADYVITNTDGYRTISVTTGSSNRTVTLPAAAAANSGQIRTIEKADSGTGFVLFSGTVNGFSPAKLFQQYEAVTIKSNGSAWNLVSAKWASGTWTPVLTNISNVTLGSTTTDNYYFFRVNNFVHFSGRTSVRSAGSSTTQLGISQPIAGMSTFSAGADAYGTLTPSGRTDGLGCGEIGANIVGNVLATNFDVTGASTIQVTTTGVFIIK